MNQSLLDRPEPTDLEQGSPFFRRLGESVLRWRWIWLLVIGAVTAGAIYSIKTQLMVDNSVEAFGSTKDNSMNVLEEFRDVFGRDELFVVLVEGPVFTTEFLKKLDALHTELGSIDMEIPSLGERKRDRDAARDQLGLKGSAEAGESSAPRGPPAPPPGYPAGIAISSRPR